MAVRYVRRIRQHPSPAFCRPINRPLRIVVGHGRDDQRPVVDLTNTKLDSNTHCTALRGTLQNTSVLVWWYSTRVQRGIRRAAPLACVFEDVRIDPLPQLNSTAGLLSHTALPPWGITVSTRLLCMHYAILCHACESRRPVELSHHRSISGRGGRVARGESAGPAVSTTSPTFPAIPSACAEGTWQNRVSRRLFAHSVASPRYPDIYNSVAYPL